MRDLARLLGVTAAAVKQAVDGGRVSRRADGWIDLESAAAEFRGTSTGSSNGYGAEPADTDPDQPPGESLASAKTRKERALADKAEVDAARARGDAVDIGEASRAWYSAARVLRERLLALPDRAGPALGLTAEQVTGLRGELVRELTELSDTMPEIPR